MACRERICGGIELFSTFQARRRMLGNIQFIGQLYKKKMLTERIMHECIVKLLGEVASPEPEDVECLCKLMTTIGQQIDVPKSKSHMEIYFKRIGQLAQNKTLESRLRFMLQDVVDLRRNGWVERRKVHTNPSDLVIHFCRLICLNMRYIR
eukprot:scaffold300056_cov49-Prasinocladus_malaysianus.AAC.2